MNAAISRCQAGSDADFPILTKVAVAVWVAVHHRAAPSEEDRLLTASVQLEPIWTAATRAANAVRSTPPEVRPNLPGADHEDRRAAEGLSLDRAATAFGLGRLDEGSKYSEIVWWPGASAQVSPWMPGRAPQYFRTVTEGTWAALHNRQAADYPLLPRRPVC